MSLEQEISSQKITQNHPEDFLLKATSLTPDQMQSLLKTKIQRKNLRRSFKKEKTLDSFYRSFVAF